MQTFSYKITQDLTREAFVEIQATSKEEAKKILENMKSNQINWQNSYSESEYEIEEIE
jgi:hypothetical protein